jgi:phytoene dehydrogenase-like protein
MLERPAKIVIVGGGIAGLCAGVYASKCGYDALVLEQHTVPGGLATSWRRGDYTFETCLHWLLGSKPNGPLNARWREVFDIDRLSFIDPTEYARIVGETGEELPIYTDVSRMEAELLKHAPRDAMAIRELASTVRRLASFKMPDDFWPPSWGTLLRILPSLPLLRRLSRSSIEQYGKRFRHPLLRGFFGTGDTSSLPALALLLSLAWMSERNAGYPIGGSQALIRLIVENFERLGGELRLGAKVKRILVENDAAVGVQLEGGETVAGEWVISAADGHATIYELLGGQYADEGIDRIYRTLRPFPSYLQVSFGIARDLSQEAPFITRLLGEPLWIDPGTELDRVSFRIFHYDPSFAPPGRTAVTCFLPTRSFAYWVDLKAHDPTRYALEKRRIAEAVTTILEKGMPRLRQAIEVTDVSTPATVIDHTGNWQGSMEGWLMTPRTGVKPLRSTLPGLRQFLMIGQWVLPGGGLPSGLITARSALRAVCKHDHVLFTPEATVGRYHEAA